MRRRTKQIILDAKRDVTISPYIISQKKTPCIMIFPGGAYSNCEESEAVPVAKKFNELGFNCVVLRYSVGKNYQWPRPLEDYEQGVAYCKSHAEEWHLDMDHLITIGFSAGGHLSSATATLAKTKPFASVIAYGVTTEDTLSFCAPDAPDTAQSVDENTAPCFLVYSRTDWIVGIENSLKFMEALEQNFIDFESHIYGWSMHGFSVGQEAGTPRFSERCGNWVPEFVSWLNDLMGEYETIRKNAPYVDSHSDHLSAGNSCGVLFANRKAARIIKTHFPLWYFVYLFVKKSKPDYIATASMRNIMELLKCNQKTISKMDAMLEELN